MQGDSKAALHPCPSASSLHSSPGSLVNSSRMSQSSEEPSPIFCDQQTSQHRHHTCGPHRQLVMQDTKPHPPQVVDVTSPFYACEDKTNVMPMSPSPWDSIDKFQLETGGLTVAPPARGFISPIKLSPLKIGLDMDAINATPTKKSGSASPMSTQKVEPVKELNSLSNQSPITRSDQVSCDDRGDEQASLVVCTLDSVSEKDAASGTIEPRSSKFIEVGSI